MRISLLLTFALTATRVAQAHDGHVHAPFEVMQTGIVKLNAEPSVWLTSSGRVVRSNDDRPELAKYFEPFENKVKVRFDTQHLLVESNGMPDHSMMTGITAWQQQVPLPQRYSGDNAWRIPLKPVPAKNPMSAKTNFFRGAIALAVNGVPIFNPIKNDGKTDTLLAGELDQWGGHCGRADDYHYHVAPVHLEKVVGKGRPVGVALDGYPIYGYEDPNGEAPTDLDWLNGHKDADGNYHYHATKTYPYLNGGFYGEVVERGGQVDPQPRAQGVRPAARPLRGAKITGFENPKTDNYVLRYEVFGENRSIDYDINDDGSATFRFVSPSGTKKETFSPRRQQGVGGDRPNQRPPRDDRAQPRAPEQAGNARPVGSVVDPLMQELDNNHDGILDGPEIAKAAGVLRSFDRDRDGDLSAEEIAGGTREPRPNRDGQPGGQRGPEPSDGPRQPWILVHADEVDLNHDKVITREEIVGEATQAFAGYDADDDGKLTEAEYGGRGGARSAMGGFIRGHAEELDRDSDGILTRAEVVGNAERMFGKMDSNGDGKITPEEMEASRRE